MSEAMAGNGRLVVAVAGATGHAGKEIVRALTGRGVRVRALARDPERLGYIRDRCREVVTTEVTRSASLQGALDGATYLVSAVGKTWQKDNTPRHAVDVGANVNLFQEARRAGVQRIAFISVAGAGPDHPVTLMRMKAEAEQALRDTGIPYVIIRPSGYFSDLWEVFKMCEKGTFYCIGDGKLRFNPISLEDLGDFVVDSLFDDSKLGQALPVGGPEVLETLELPKLCERVLVKPVRIRHLPLWLAKAAVAAIKPFNRNLWEMSEFFVGNTEYGMRSGNETIVPAYGSRRLEDYYRRRYAEEHSIFQSKNDPEIHF